MSKKTFDPAKWQPTETTKQTSTPTQSLPIGEVGGASDIETITQRIEAASLDIARIMPIGETLALPSLTLWAKVDGIIITA